MDLNDDGKLDIIYTIENSFYCGSGGCSLNILLNINNKYRYIPVTVLNYKDYIYVLNNKTKGLKDLIVNDKCLIRFNGKEYELIKCL